MTEAESLPRWQKGERVFEATIPAKRAKSGRDETVELAVNWEVIATRPMTDRDKIDWETARARETLQRAERALEDEAMFTVRDADALSSSLNDAIRAWYRAHLGGAGPSDFDTQNTFLANAPQSLSEMTVKAQDSLHRMRWNSIVLPSEAVAEVRQAVDAVLDRL